MCSCLCGCLCSVPYLWLVAGASCASCLLVNKRAGTGIQLGVPINHGLKHFGFSLCSGMFHLLSNMICALSFVLVSPLVHLFLEECVRCVLLCPSGSMRNPVRVSLSIPAVLTKVAIESGSPREGGCASFPCVRSFVRYLELNALCYVFVVLMSVLVFVLFVLVWLPLKGGHTLLL